MDGVEEIVCRIERSLKVIEMLRQAHPTHSPQLTELFLRDGTKNFAAAARVVSPENGNSAGSLNNNFLFSHFKVGK